MAFQQQKDKLAQLQNRHEVYYTFEFRHQNERFIVCIDRTNSTDEMLHIERIVNFDSGVDVSDDWFRTGIVDEVEDQLHELAKERFAYLRESYSGENG